MNGIGIDGCTGVQQALVLTLQIIRVSNQGIESRSTTDVKGFDCICSDETCFSQSARDIQQSMCFEINVRKTQTNTCKTSDKFSARFLHFGQERPQART